MSTIEEPAAGRWVAVQGEPADQLLLALAPYGPKYIRDYKFRFLGRSEEEGRTRFEFAHPDHGRFAVSFQNLELLNDHGRDQVKPERGAWAVSYSGEGELELEVTQGDLGLIRLLPATYRADWLAVERFELELAPGACPSCGSTRIRAAFQAELELEAQPDGSYAADPASISYKNVLATARCAECGVTHPIAHFGQMKAPVTGIPFQDADLSIG